MDTRPGRSPYSRSPVAPGRAAASARRGVQRSQATPAGYRITPECRPALTSSPETRVSTGTVPRKLSVLVHAVIVRHTVSFHATTTSSMKKARPSTRPATVRPSPCSTSRPGGPTPYGMPKTSAPTPSVLDRAPRGVRDAAPAFPDSTLDVCRPDAAIKLGTSTPGTFLGVR